MPVGEGSASVSAVWEQKPCSSLNRDNSLILRIISYEGVGGSDGLANKK